MGSLAVAAIQYDIVWHDVEANLAAVGPMVDSAVAAGARLILLPELFATGFGPALDEQAESAGGPAASFLAEKAAEHGVWVGGSVAVREAAETRPVNRFLLFGPDGPVVHYDKRHLFGFAGEDRFMTAGDDVVTVEVAGVRISPFICYDLRFADDFWDVGPTTDLFVVVANWPAERAAHFRALLVARAIENQAYVVGVNRVGDAHGLAHDGESVVVDPWGAVVVEAGDTDAMIVATIDTDTVARSRTDFPTVADRR